MTSARPDRTRSIWALFLAGPVIWFSHFMAVYLLVEAACATVVPDSELLGLPILSTTTLVATAGAVLLTAWTSARALARWRAGSSDRDWLEVTDRNPGLAFAGFLLGVLSIAAICFVGLPAAFLEPC